MIDLKMARHTVTAVALALLFVATSTIDRTTITIVEFDDEANPRRRGGGQQFRQPVSRQQLRQCEQYITQGRSYIVLPRHEGGRESFQRCSQQLRKMDPQCQCEWLRQIMQERRQRGEYKRKEPGEVVQRAQNLPNECRLGRQHCDICSYGGGGGY